MHTRQGESFMLHQLEKTIVEVVEKVVPSVVSVSTAQLAIKISDCC